MAKETKTEMLARIQVTIAGIQKFFPNAPTLTLKGKATATPAVFQLLQSYASAIVASQAAQATAHEAVAAEQALAAQVGPVLLNIKGMVVSQLGDSPAVLNQFGIVASAPRTPTAQVKAQAVLKRRTTRVVRGTKGKRQKEEASATPAATSTPPATAKA